MLMRLSSRARPFTSCARLPLRHAALLRPAALASQTTSSLRQPPISIRTRASEVEDPQVEDDEFAVEDEAFSLAEYSDEFDDLDEVSGGASMNPTVSSESVKLRVRMRGYDIDLLRDAVEQIRAVAEATGVRFAGPVMLPTRRKLYCVLRSPHVNKDAREHFEVRTHHRLVDLQDLSSQAVEAMMQWVPPPGLEVDCRIVPA